MRPANQFPTAFNVRTRYIHQLTGVDIDELHFPSRPVPSAPAPAPFAALPRMHVEKSYTVTLYNSGMKSQLSECRRIYVYGMNYAPYSNSCILYN